MTVSYSAEVATARGLGNFHRLLRRWRGGIYKLVWMDTVIYVVSYFALSLFYRFYLNTEERRDSKGHRLFRNIVIYCENYSKFIPLSFILGFYVSLVVKRWWEQFLLLPWPDNLATLISTNIHGHDERGRLMRRTIMRYLNLGFVSVMRMMSTTAKKRFPTLNHVVEAGFLLPHEQVIIDHLNEKTTYAKYWVPIVWCGAILSRARREKRLLDDMSMNEIINQFAKFRSGLGDLLNYDWATIPLMYTQSVTLVFYVYFAAQIFAKQFVEDKENRIDLYFPFVTFIEFFFYVGWLKVAETLVNPFGEDDDDFEVNWLIDRNIQVSYVIVDEMHSDFPPLLKDQYWNETGEVVLPYTEAAIKYKADERGQVGSTNNVEVDQDKAQFITDDNLEIVTSARSTFSHHSVVNLNMIRSMKSVSSGLRMNGAPSTIDRRKRERIKMKGDFSGDNDSDKSKK